MQTTVFFPLPEYLLPWFYANQRNLPWRQSKNAYAVWVSEIMLQQTRVEAAKAHYIRFMQTLPTVFDLAACEDETLMKLWEGLGYYSRARNLKKCAQQVVEEYGGVFPSDKKLLQKLPGIGEYTAGAVSSIAYEQKNPAIDGNVLRICARIEGNFAPIDSVERKRTLYQKLQSVYPDAAGDYTQSLMELGALICLPENPKCNICPMQGRCVAERDGLQNKLPVIPKKAEKKKVTLSVFVLKTPKGILLCKRPDKGVLAGMWQFPNVEVDPKNPLSLKMQLGGLGIKNYTVLKEQGHTHVFTHLIWDMTAYLVETSDMPPAFLSFSLQELEQNVSLATAFKWCLRLL